MAHRGLNPESLDIMARTIYAETHRDQGDKGMYGVAWIIKNRLGRYGDSIAEVCLRPKQFTVWNEGTPVPDTNLSNNKRYRRAMIIALEVLDSNDDITYNATHYHHKDISPWWAQGHLPIYRDSMHLFYNDIDEKI